jgi:capsular exopolysaccharide synthesis family protein
MDAHRVELIDYLNILRRRAILMLVVIIACVGGAFGATSLQHKVYAAHAELIVDGSSSASIADEIAERQLASGRAQAFAEIAQTQPAVLASIAYANTTAGPFASGGVSVTATADGSSPFINLTVKGSNPKQLAAVANAYKLTLPKVLTSLNQEPAFIADQVSLLQAATVPSSPISPHPSRNIVFGLGIGAALAFLAAFVQETLDRRVRDSEEVESITKVAVLGVVPHELEKSTLPVITDPHSARAEAYRKVRTNLLFTGPQGMPRVLLVTSAVSGEGKTTMAVNLALACARAGQKVGLVDADLRRPMVSSYLGIDGSIGLSDVLAGKVRLSEAIQSVDEGRVDVLPAGSIPANPSEVVGSMQMRDIMEPFIASHDVVILDTPPVLPVSDALVMAGRVEGVILVARLGEITRSRLLTARDSIRKVKGNLVGIVPNAVVLREDSAYSYAYRPGRKNADAYYRSPAAANGSAPALPVVPDHDFTEPSGDPQPELSPSTYTAGSARGRRSPAVRARRTRQTSVTAADKIGTAWSVDAGEAASGADTPAKK